MNITAQAAELKKLLKPFSMFDGKLLIDTRTGTLAATNDTLFLSVTASIFQTTEAQRVAVDIDKLLTIVNKAAGPVQITCAPGDYRLQITNKSARYELVGSTNWYGEFPQVPEGTVSFELPTKELKRITSFAAIASDASSRFDYVGSVQVLALSVPKAMTAAGSDGIRLMAAAAPCPITGPDKELLIPLPGIKALSIFDEETVLVTAWETAVMFATPTTVLAVKQLAKKFPSCTDLIPTKFDMIAKVDAKVAAEALDRVLPMIHSESKTRPVEMIFKAGVLTLATHGDVGTAAETTALRMVTPDPLFEEDFSAIIRANADYLLDFFKSVAGEVTIKAGAGNAPLLLEANDKSMLLAKIAGGSQ